ncbi:hypothetical protein BpHYR1_031416 [Brachionus plicatilis]|uniref:Adipose-secreted signaling protein n=1 Tax=Brachionus plicatilis TaxID=10195 RepID=A0A3M7RHP0_BRAPC|nr:hypothetical protein BpHYR1_031416 [Brachionus plicatilis]
MSAGIDHPHHVKFNLQEEEIKNHHENLDIIKYENNKFDINVGYLKIDHYYKVVFCLKLDNNYGNVEFVRDLSSPQVSLKELKKKADFSKGEYEMTFVFYASKEKHDKETIFLRLGDEETNMLEINFEAKVLGAHQGTPLLRNGITLLSNHIDHLNSTSSQKLHFNIN